MNSLIQRKIDSWNIQDATKLTAFCACPRKYFWEYVLGWKPEAPSNHLVYGQAWHSAMEYLLLNDYSIASVQKAHQIFLEVYRKTFLPDTDEIFFPKTPENALFALARYVGKFREDHSIFKVLYTEISGKVTVGENRYMHFRMDSILENRNNGQIVSIDHKTGSSTWGWERQFPLSHQTGTYTHVLYCLYPRDLVRGVVFRGTFLGKTKKAWDQIHTGTTLTYKDPIEFVEYPAFRNEDQMQSWLWHVNFWLDQVGFQFELLQECSEDDPVMTAFPQNPTSCTMYGGCQYADFCNSWQNPLQKCDEPPLNYREEHWDPTKEATKNVFNI